MFTVKISARVAFKVGVALDGGILSYCPVRKRATVSPHTARLEIRVLQVIAGVFIVSDFGSRALQAGSYCDICRNSRTPSTSQMVFHNAYRPRPRCIIGGNGRLIPGLQATGVLTCVRQPPTRSVISYVFQGGPLWGLWGLLGPPDESLKLKI